MVQEGNREVEGKYLRRQRGLILGKPLRKTTSKRRPFFFPSRMSLKCHWPRINSDMDELYPIGQLWFVYGFAEGPRDAGWIRIDGVVRILRDVIFECLLLRGNL